MYARRSGAVEQIHQWLGEDLNQVSDPEDGYRGFVALPQLVHAEPRLSLVVAGPDQAGVPAKRIAHRPSFHHSSPEHPLPGMTMRSEQHLAIHLRTPWLTCAVHRSTVLARAERPGDVGT